MSLSVQRPSRIAERLGRVRLERLLDERITDVDDVQRSSPSLVRYTCVPYLLEVHKRGMHAGGDSIRELRDRFGVGGVFQ